MGVVLRGLEEELVAIGQMMLCRRGSRGERRLNALGMGHFEGTIDLVGTNVVKQMPFSPLRSLFSIPISLRSLKQTQRSHYVSLGEGERVLDGAVHMALSGKMDDAIDLFILHQLVNTVEVANVHADELIVGLVLDVLQVGKVAGIGQLIEINNLIIRIFVYKKANDMASDESSTASDDDISFHFFKFLAKLKTILQFSK